MATHSSILAWRISHGQRSLVGYSPWDRKESGRTEQLSTHKAVFGHLPIQTLPMFVVFRINKIFFYSNRNLFFIIFHSWLQK